MSEERRRLEREARVFGRYLSGRTPPESLVAKYVDGHARADVAAGRGADRFDRFLVAFARAGVLPARVADVWSAFLRRRSVLRRKLVLAVALLECAPPGSTALDRPDRGPAWLAWPLLVLRGVREGLLLLLGALPLLAALGVSALFPARREEGSR